MIEINDQAGIAAGLGLIAAAIWKIWLRLKSDTREDQTDQRRHRAERGQYDHYERLIANLTSELDRISKSVAEIQSELEAEREARYKAEDIANKLRIEVDTLRDEIQKLKGHK